MLARNKINSFFVAIISVTALSFASYAMAKEKSHIIAKVNGKAIYNTDILPPKNLAEHNQKTLSPEKFKAWDDRYKKLALFVKITTPLKHEFLKSHHNEPAEKDIQSYIQFANRLERGRIISLRQQYNEKVEQLKAKGLDKDVKQLLVANVKTIEKLLALETQLANKTRNMQNYKKIVQQAKRRVAKNVASDWKYKQSLYKTYGGRITLEQSGLEPIEADAAVMKSWRDTKAFEIVDPAYADVFTQYEKFLKGPHKFLKGKNIKKVFDNPYWELGPPKK